MHQGKDADRKKDRGRECAQKTEPAPGAHEKINGYDGPDHEGGGFVEIIYRAAGKSEAALEQGCAVKDEGERKQKITDPVIASEAFAPEENRIDGAEAVNDHGEQKISSISKTNHRERLIYAVRPGKHISCLSPPRK